MSRDSDALELYTDLAENALTRNDPSTYIDPVIEIANILLDTNRLEEVGEYIEIIKSFDLLSVDFNLAGTSDECKGSFGNNEWEL
jgi:hypothetical protein